MEGEEEPPEVSEYILEIIKVVYKETRLENHKNEVTFRATESTGESQATIQRHVFTDPTLFTSGCF